MTSLRNAAFAALFLSTAAFQSAGAMTLPAVPAQRAETVKTEFVFADAIAPARLGRLDRVDADAANAAVQNYFDFDAVITLGALVIAAGAFGAFAATAAARRRQEDEIAERENEPAWRDSVFRAVQADLTAFTNSFRRAA